MPVRYRQADETGWASGVTVNVSRSGLLFRGDRTIPDGTGVEAIVTLKSSRTECVCRGRIVRLQLDESSGATMMAAAVSYDTISTLT